VIIRKRKATLARNKIAEACYFWGHEHKWLIKAIESSPSVFCGGGAVVADSHRIRLVVRAHVLLEFSSSQQVWFFPQLILSSGSRDRTADRQDWQVRGRQTAGEKYNNYIDDGPVPFWCFSKPWLWQWAGRHKTRTLKMKQLNGIQTSLISLWCLSWSGPVNQSLSPELKLADPETVCLMVHFIRRWQPIWPMMSDVASVFFLFIHLWAGYLWAG